MWKRSLTAAAVLAVLAAVAWRVHTGTRNSVAVVNEAGQPIRALTVTVGGETIHFEGISDGATASAPFRIRSDDHFAVSGELADGTAFGGDYGYVTNGMYGERARFRILPGPRLEFEQGRGGV
jgi:hypothetical protein